MLLWCIETMEKLHFARFNTAISKIQKNTFIAYVVTRDYVFFYLKVELCLLKRNGPTKQNLKEN